MLLSIQSIQLLAILFSKRCYIPKIVTSIDPSKNECGGLEALRDSKMRWHLVGELCSNNVKSRFCASIQGDTPGYANICINSEPYFHNVTQFKKIRILYLFYLPNQLKGRSDRPTR